MRLGDQHPEKPSPVQPTPEHIVLTRVRGEVARQLKDSAAPEEVHDFLWRHWSRLMTRIFMAKGNRDPDWQAGWDTMNALLWSLAPKKGRKETSMMLRALPALLARLHEGCTALGLPGQERDAFFEGLSLLHAAVAREGLHTVDGKGRPAAMDEASALAREGGIELPELPQPSQTLEGEFSAPPESQGEVPAMDVGARLLLRVEEEDRPMILTWLSPMGGMYLFTSESGQESLSLTRSRLATKFQQGEARLLGA